MKNIFIRTALAPYRIDLYNKLHNLFSMELLFYRRKDLSQETNMDMLEELCEFTPHYLNGFEFGKSSRKFCYGLFSILKKNKPDIIIVPEFQIVAIQILFFRFFLRKKIKVVSMCDDSYDMIVNKNDFTIVHKISRKILMYFLDNVIVVEPKVMEWYQKHYKKGIWLPIIRDENKERTDYQRVLNLSNFLNEKYNLKGKKVILSVGRLVALKNLSRFLSSVANLKEDCVVVIIGSGPEEISLKSQAESINKTIIFLGRLEGDVLRAWYNISEIFVLLSTQEPFGAVTNEALLAGNYAIVSEKAGSSCLIEENVNGSIINPYDVIMISTTIDNWLMKIKNKTNKIILKPDLMKVSFHERVENLRNKLLNNGKN